MNRRMVCFVGLASGIALSGFSLGAVWSSTEVPRLVTSMGFVGAILFHSSSIGIVLFEINRNRELILKLESESEEA